MKNNRIFAVIVATLITCCFASLGAVTLKANAQTPAAETAVKNEIQVVKDLEWTSISDAAIWGEVNKEATCAGGPIVVNGIDYSANSIGLHLPADNAAHKDIVYDITNYSNDYPYFVTQVAQPDDGCNNVKFSILVDGVVKDSYVWSHDRFGTSACNDTTTPVVLRAYVKGANTLTLRVEQGHVDWANGSCAFINVRLQKETIGEGYVYANRILERANATLGGYDSGYGTGVLFDRQIDNRPFEFPIYADVLSYEEGLSSHLIDTNYTTIYSANKADTSKFVSYKWNIENMNFSYFSAVAVNQASTGFHVDLWADGVEISTSGLINSIDTCVATGLAPASAPQEVKAAIPAGTKEFELRIVADNWFGNGGINIMAPTFFVASDKLISLDAEQVTPNIWMFESVRGRMWDGKKADIYISANDSVSIVEDGFFFVAGSEGDATTYTFDISGINHNALKGVFGKAGSYFFKGEGTSAEQTPVTLASKVIYADGSSEIKRTEAVSWDNSGIPVDIATWGEGAVTLKLWTESATAAHSETVLANAIFYDVYTVSYDLGDSKSTVTYEPDSALVKPADPVKEGYTFEGWVLEGESDVYDFTDKTVSGHMVFNAKWSANSYAITYMQQLDEADATVASGYAPASHVYDKTTELPTALEIEGYDFIGWFVDGAKVSELSASTYSADITVIAKYAVKKFTVSFYNGEALVETQTVEYGKFASTVDAGSMTGHNFAGWTLENGEVFDFGATNVTSDIKLIAKWSAHVFAITYIHKLGTSEEPANDYTLTTHTFGIDTLLPEAKEIEGYVFEGWFVNGVQVTVLGGSEYFENIAVVGKYSIATFDVTFIDEGEESIVNYEYNQKINRVPVKEGATFEGWYLDEACTQAYDVETPITADITLYAKWTKLASCRSNVSGNFALISLCLMAGVLFALKSRKKEQR